MQTFSVKCLQNNKNKSYIKKEEELKKEKINTELCLVRAHQARGGQNENFFEVSKVKKMIRLKVIYNCVRLKEFIWYSQLQQTTQISYETHKAHAKKATKISYAYINRRKE